MPDYETGIPTITCKAATTPLTGSIFEPMLDHVIIRAPTTNALIAKYYCSGGLTWTAQIPYKTEIVLDPTETVGFIGAGFFLLLPLWAAIYGGRALIRAMQ